MGNKDLNKGGHTMMKSYEAHEKAMQDLNQSILRIANIQMTAVITALNQTRPMVMPNLKHFNGIYNRLRKEKQALKAYTANPKYKREEANSIREAWETLRDAINNAESKDDGIRRFNTTKYTRDLQDIGAYLNILK